MPSVAPDLGLGALGLGLDTLVKNYDSPLNSTSETAVYKHEGVAFCQWPCPGLLEGKGVGMTNQTCVKRGKLSKESRFLNSGLIVLHTVMWCKHMLRLFHT